MKCVTCGKDDVSCFQKPTDYKIGISWCRQCGTVICSYYESGVFGSSYVPEIAKTAESQQ